MRVAVRSVLVMGIMAVSAVAGPVNTSNAASWSPQLDVESLLPAEGAVVGVAHPLVVTFDGPVVNRRVAERALQVKSDPPMTGRFEWVESNVVQWVPDEFWPAHSAVALSVSNLPTRNFDTGPAVIGVADLSAPVLR